MANILIIDDDPVISKLLSKMIGRNGHRAVCQATLQSGVAEASSGLYDIVFLDVHLPDGNGLEILPRIRQAPASPTVIILTGYGDPDGASIAIKNGAWDYIQKTDDHEKILFQIKRVLEFRKWMHLSRDKPVALNLNGIIGSSPKMKACYDLVSRAAHNDANVCLIGETGTGKELFARAIHTNSARRNGPLVTVDCSVLHQNLKESDLFGYRKGAFTGADTNKDGLIALADGGSLFLDEIGDLSRAGQGLFLRVLQENQFRPLGGKHEIHSDFRLIAATNKDIEQMARDGRFRTDLLFRLRSIVIELPPLRKRDDDIEALALHYMQKLCERLECGAKGLTSEFKDALRSYSWPGNVRELIKALENALAAARDVPTLFPIHLPPHIRADLIKRTIEQLQTKENSVCKPAQLFKHLPSLADLLETTECKYLQYLYKQTGGNLNRICHLSGLSRSALYRRLKKYQIQRGD